MTKLCGRLGREIYLELDGRGQTALQPAEARELERTGRQSLDAAEQLAHGVDVGTDRGALRQLIEDGAPRMPQATGRRRVGEQLGMSAHDSASTSWERRWRMMSQ